MEEESLYEILDEKLDIQNVDESGDSGKLENLCSSYDVLGSADNRNAEERSPSTEQESEHQKNFNADSDPSKINGNFDNIAIKEVETHVKMKATERIESWNL